MKRAICFGVILVLTMFFTGHVLAQDPVVYPANGQSNDQMEKDKFECYGWAKQQSGFDPMAAPTATAPPPAREAPKGGVGRGAVGGGLGGAAIGAITGGSSGAKKGAAIGAVGGGLVGGMRRSEQRRQEDQRQRQWEQQQTANYANNRQSYNRAFGACMEGRGYSVK